jgi:ABC-type multidrug transport system ATPase subunit
MANVITGDKIHKTFISDKGVVTRALDNVSFEVRRGALTALVGPDGAGKTTLMRLAAGLMTAEQGIACSLPPFSWRRTHKRRRVPLPGHCRARRKGRRHPDH